MSLEASVRKFAAELECAITRDDWERVDLCRERLKALLLDAAREAIRPEIARIDAALSQARGKLVFGREIDLTPGPNGAAWMLAADVETARLAGRLLPSPTAQPVDGSAKDRVMVVLETTNYSGLTNSQIKDGTGLTAETVARVLKALREEGRVTSRKVGRYVINRPVSRTSGPATEMEHLRVQDPTLYLMIAA